MDKGNESEIKNWRDGSEFEIRKFRIIVEFFIVLDF